MGLKRLTIPYVLDDRSRGQPFTRELELASLYIVGDTRRGTEALEAASFATYPILFKLYDGGSLMVDLLGLHKTSLKYDIIPDVEAFIKAINKFSVEPKKYLKTLKGLSGHFKDFTGQETLTFKGLVAHPPNPREINCLLERAKTQETKVISAIFSPILGNKEVKSVVNSLKKHNKTLEQDQKTLEKTKKSLQESQDIARKVLREEKLNINDSSAKIQEQLKRAIEKKRARLKKKMNRETARVREAYKRKVGPLREERTKRKRKLTRAEKRISRLKSEDSREKLDSEKKSLIEQKKKFGELERAVKSLQEERDAEIKALTGQFKDELKGDEEKLADERSQTLDRLEEIKSIEVEILAEAKAISGQIDSLNRRKKKKLKAVDKYKIELDEGDLEISIPFYVFHFGQKRFDFHPPVEVVDSPSLLSRFRLMLTDGLESKVSKLIRPRGGFSNRFLERAVKSLGRDNPVGRAYRQEAERLNLFRSREAVDQIMLGLVRLRRGGWINDGDYIRLQEAIIDHIGSISQP
ncbi:hypothetical protein CL673_04645 [Candidatus Bathyarchaeota archaeon]|jgi:hypothetical protein|nr:hypothetical protein [Candidatus Bathyarchaeota archaeon]